MKSPMYKGFRCFARMIRPVKLYSINMVYTLEKQPQTALDSSIGRPGVLYEESLVLSAVVLGLIPGLWPFVARLPFLSSFLFLIPCQTTVHERPLVPKKTLKIKPNQT